MKSLTSVQDKVVLTGRSAYDGALMGLGAFILMITRPFEGMLPCVLVAVAVVVRMVRDRRALARPTLTRVLLPVMLMVGASDGVLLQHNQATTGDPFKALYALNRQTYASVPAFLISPPL